MVGGWGCLLKHTKLPDLRESLVNDKRERGEGKTTAQVFANASWSSISLCHGEPCEEGALP